jgi:hypothetical protein
VERPTAQNRSSEYVGHLAVAAPRTQSLCFTTREVTSLSSPYPSRAAVWPSRCAHSWIQGRRTLLFDSLKDSKLSFVEQDIPSTQMTVHLATGATVRLKKRVVNIHYACDRHELDDDFIVLDLEDKFDVIPGMPCLRKHEPWSIGSVGPFGWTQI